MCLLIKTKCSKLTFSDYIDSVISNLKDNLSLNQIKDRFDILQLDWRDYEKVNEQYDVVIGTELIYQGGYIEELSKLIKRVLKEIGKCPRCGNKVYVGKRNYYCSTEVAQENYLQPVQLYQIL